VANDGDTWLNKVGDIFDIKFVGAVSVVECEEAGVDKLEDIVVVTEKEISVEDGVGGEVRRESSDVRGEVDVVASEKNGRSGGSVEEAKR
jgi:hypothetical protein